MHVWSWLRPAVTFSQVTGCLTPQSLELSKCFVLIVLGPFPSSCEIFGIFGYLFGTSAACMFWLDLHIVNFIFKGHQRLLWHGLTDDRWLWHRLIDGRSVLAALESLSSEQWTELFLWLVACRWIWNDFELKLEAETLYGVDRATRR